MASNRKPRKPYRPKPVLVRPMTVSVSAEDTRTLKLIPHEELRKLREGQATSYTYNTLACRLNVGVTLAARLFDSPGLVDTLQQALHALTAIQARHTTRGTWIATGDELKALGQGLVLTDEMQDQSTRREHLKVLQEVYRHAAT